MTANRVISKSSAGRQDILFGNGQVTQTRAGGSYPINKVSMVWACAAHAELLTLDTTQFTQATVNYQGAITHWGWTGSYWYCQETDLTLVGSFTDGFTYASASQVGCTATEIYSCGGAVPQVVAPGTDPATVGSDYVPRTDVLLRKVSTISFNSVAEMIAMAAGIAAGSRIFVSGYYTAGDGGAGFYTIKAGTSSYPLINPQVTPSLFAEILPIDSMFTTSQAGCLNGDATQELRQALLFSVGVKAKLVQNAEVVLKTPLDVHTFVRLPVNSAFTQHGPENVQLTIRPQSGVTRDAAVCLESFAGLQGAEPAMVVGTRVGVLNVRCVTTDGGDVKVGVALIGAMFSCNFADIRSAGFQRHNILVCRSWYASYGKLFGSAGRGSGVTFGRHPDVNQTWVAECNASSIDEVWAHTNGTTGLWVEDSAEDLGYGVGFYGTMISMRFGKIVSELNKGAGVQNSFKYGSWEADGMYLEGNTGRAFYSNVIASAGIAWKCLGISLLSGQSIRIKPDSLTTAEIGVPFASDNNTADVTGVSPSRVTVNRNTAYSMRNALKGLARGNETFGKAQVTGLGFSAVVNGMAGVRGAEFDNNYQLVFVPFATTTSTTNFGFRVRADGVSFIDSVKAGPFTAYQEVELASWSGMQDVYYDTTVTAQYGETVAGLLLLRARYL